MMGAFAVASCASVDPVMNRGDVIGKEYNSAYSERIDKCVKWKPRVQHSNSTCTQWKTHYDYHNECWRLILDNNGEVGDVCVSLVVYQNYRVGDHYQRS